VEKGGGMRELLFCVFLSTESKKNRRHSRSKKRLHLLWVTDSVKDVGVERSHQKARHKARLVGGRKIILTGMSKTGKNKANPASPILGQP